MQACKFVVRVKVKKRLNLSFILVLTVSMQCQELQLASTEQLPHGVWNSGVHYNSDCGSTDLLYS